MIAVCTDRESNAPLIDIELKEGYDIRRKDREVPCERLPYVLVDIPEKLLPSEYQGSGYFTVDLDTLLMDYMLQYWSWSHGEHTPKVIEILREFADRIEADLQRRTEELQDYLDRHPEEKEAHEQEKREHEERMEKI